jgi:hypothetical protein
MGSLPITVPPKGTEEAPSPRRGFFFSGFGFRGTPPTTSLDTAQLKADGWHDAGRGPGSSEGDFIDWLTIKSQAESVTSDVRRIRSHPLVPGSVIDLDEFMELRKVVRTMEWFGLRCVHRGTDKCVTHEGDSRIGGDLIQHGNGGGLPWLVQLRCGKTLTRWRCGGWRSRRGTRTKAGAFWRLPRFTTGARVGKRHALAVSVCRQSATGCCGSMPGGRTVSSMARRRDGRPSSTTPSARNSPASSRAARSRRSMGSCAGG